MPYLKDGFFLERQIIKKQVLDIRKKIDKIFRSYYKSRKDLNKLIIYLFNKDFDGFYGCANACQNLLEINNLSSSIIIKKSLKKFGLKIPIINTRPLVSFSCISTSKNINYWKVSAHQDWPSTQGSLNGITCWIPIVDVSINNGLGPLEVVRSSHLDGLYPFKNEIKIPVLENYENKQLFESIDMKVGDALFFSNFLIHKSGVNIHKNKIRISMHFRYDDFLEETYVARKCPRLREDKKIEFKFNDFPSKKQILKNFEK